MRRVALLALTMLPLASGMGWAQATPTDAGAQALEQQIRAWITQTLGPDVKLSKRLVGVKAQGDHYGFTVPLGDGADAPVITANGVPRLDGRWAIDTIRVPSPATFHVELPAKMAEQAPDMPRDMTYHLTIGQQSGEMLLDPSFATTTTSNSSIRDMNLTADGPLAQTSHVDRATSSFVSQPAGGERVNVAIQTGFEGYKITSALPNMPEPFTLGMGRVALNSSFDNVSRARLGQLVQGVAKLVSLAPAQGTTPTPAQKQAAEALAKSLLPVLTDLASGVSFDEKIDDLTLAMSDMSGALRTLRIGFGGRANDGLLQMSLDLGAEGLTLPELGLGSKLELLPTKVALRPVVSGVPTAVLAKMLQKAGDGGGPAPEDIAAMFARGGVVAGLDSLVIEAGGAQMLAQGKVTLTSPTAYTGAGQVSISNLDQLQAKIAADPDLAQAAPAIIFLKGIGRSEQNRMVWDIAYKGGKLIVNNQDMSMLLGAAGGGGAPSQDATPAAPPTAQQGHRDLRRKP